MARTKDLIFKDDVRKMTLQTNEFALGSVTLQNDSIMVQKNEMPKRGFLQSLKASDPSRAAQPDTRLGLGRNRNPSKTLVEFDMNYGLNQARGSVLQR